MVHVFNFKDNYYIFDTGSSSLHECDEKCALILREKLGETVDTSAITPEERKEYEADLAELQAQGLLFAEEVKAYPVKSNEVKALCLHICHDCNLRCKYCFADEGAYHARREFMSLEVAKKAIDFLIENSGNRKRRPSITPRSRRQSGAKSSCSPSPRTGFCSKTTSLSSSTRRWRTSFSAWTGAKKCTTPCARRRTARAALTSSSKTSKTSSRSAATRAITSAAPSRRRTSISAKTYCFWRTTGCDAYLKREAEGKGFNFFHFNVDLEGGPCLAKRVSACGAGNEYFSVVPNGDIYPCHQFAGDPAFKMGSVFEGKLDEEIRGKFKNSCLFGGCNANNYHYNGDINIPYEMTCEMMKKRTENAMHILAERKRRKGQI